MHVIGEYAVNAMHTCQSILKYLFILLCFVTQPNSESTQHQVLVARKSLNMFYFLVLHPVACNITILNVSTTFRNQENTHNLGNGGTYIEYS
jgi:hypothetical protein